MIAEIRLDAVGLERVLHGPNGPVAQDLLRRCIRVESQAKVNATGRPGPMVQSGRLRNSITHRIVESPAGLYGLVGSNVEYAGYVEFGTEPTVIFPVNRKALFWPGARHPVAYVIRTGNRAYPYLRPALVAAGP